MALQIEPEPGGVGTGRRGKTKAVLVAVLFLLMGVWICLEALQVPFGSFRMPGAGFFPLLLGMTLGAFSIVLLGMNLLVVSQQPTRLWPERRDVLYLMGAILASAWLFERAGFLLTMAPFLGVLIKVLGKIGWPTAVVLALAGSVTAYVLFSRLLLIALPSGVLPF